VLNAASTQAVKQAEELLGVYAKLSEQGAAAEKTDQGARCS
jgi:hypothetical protein